MWLYIVLFLNTTVAIAGGRLLFKSVRNYCIYLFEAVFIIYFVVRPVSICQFNALSFDLLRFGIDEITVTTYALCGLIFIISFHVAAHWFLGCRRFLSDRLLRVYDDLRHVGRRRFVSVFLLFTFASYAANVFKFHSLGYFAQNQDSFAAMMSLAGGLWFVQQLSTVMLFPLILLVARNIDHGFARLFRLLLLAIPAFLIIAKPSTRTEIIALIVTIVIYSLSIGRIRFNYITITAAVLGVIGLLFVLNLLRLGNLQSATEVSALSVVIGLAEDVSSADSGMILIDYMKHHSWLYFRYLLPSLLPFSLIPSAIFPFKPRTDIEGVLTNAIFGGDLDPLSFHEGGTLTFTVPISGYADLAFMGVIVSSVIYAFIFSSYLRGWKSESKITKFVTVYFLIITIAGFRLSIEPLMTNFYWYLLAMAGLCIMSQTRRETVTPRTE